MQWSQPASNHPSGAKGANGHRFRTVAPQGIPTSANYICHRCGVKGHFVQNCPSVGDRKAEQPKVKRTTGIPRSFLKNVESIPEGKGAMITSDGALVVAQTNE